VLVSVAVIVSLVGCESPRPVISPGAATPSQTQPARPTTSGAVAPIDSLAPGATLAPQPSGPGASPTAPIPTPFNATSWQRLGDFPFAGAFQVTSVTATPDGFAAVGFAAAPGEDYFGRRQGVVWTSVDGRAWEPSADPAFESVTPEKIVALEDALYVFGTIDPCDVDAPDECAEDVVAGWAVWRSVGGGTWEMLPQYSQFESGGIDGVTVAYGNLVAYGWAGDEQLPTIWVSADGSNWGSTTSVADMDLITVVSEAPGGVAAFGTRDSEELNDIELIAAFSPDGVSFGPVAAPDVPGTTVNALASGSAGLVGVGESADPDLNFTGFAVHSLDGQAWAVGSASDASFDGADLLAVHAVPGGFLAIGIVPDTDDLEVSAGFSWISDDGISWSGLSGFGESFTQISASAAGSVGVIVFTVTTEGFDDESGSSTPAAWILAP
jgi:hypothetical protein